MAKVIGKSGESCTSIVKSFQEERYTVLILCSCLLILSGIIYFLIIRHNMRSIGIASASFVLFAGVAFWLNKRFCWVDDQLLQSLRPWHKGAEGERSIANIIEMLPDDYVVIHDLAKPNGGNIDHIVLGPTGIFLLETKACEGDISQKDGSLLLNGRAPERDFIRQATDNTYWLKELIKEKCGINPYINTYIVFTKTSISKMAPIKEIWSTDKEHIKRNILRQRRVRLPIDEIEKAICDHKAAMGLSN